MALNGLSCPRELQMSGWAHRSAPAAAECAALWWPQSTSAYTSVTGMWSRMPGPASRSATRSSSRSFPVSCHPQIAPGQEHCGARKGCELGNRVAFSHHSAFSPFTLYTGHPENTLGQDRGRTHVPTTLCLIITRFLSEGFFFSWVL